MGDDNLSEVFGVVPLPPDRVKKFVTAIPDMTPDRLQEDLAIKDSIAESRRQLKKVLLRGEIDVDAARNVHHTLLENALAQIERLERICEQTEHARNYEVLAQWFKIALDISESIVGLNKKQTEITKAATPDEAADDVMVSPGTVVLSTTELQRLLLDAKKKGAESAK